jgi:hypothetical protein
VAQTTLRVRGLKELMRASRAAGLETKRNVAATFKPVGELVRSDAAVRFASVDAKSAAGYRTRVRQQGVFVVQSLRKTTGKHPEYGGYQMRRALIPALKSKQTQVEHKFDRAIDQVCDHWERT